MTRQFSYIAVFEPAAEGGIVVTFPAVPGLATQGETLDEAGRMAEDCLCAYLQSLAIDGEPARYEAPGLSPTRRIAVAVTAVGPADAEAGQTVPRPSFADYLLSGSAWSDDLAGLINDRARTIPDLTDGRCRVLRLDEMPDGDLEEMLKAEIPGEYRYNLADIPD